MKQNILEVNNLNISLRKEKMTLVKDVSFRVHRNRILGIIGESGSGKTIISKSIMGLLNNKKFVINGQIMFEGNNILNIHEKSMEQIRGTQLSLIMQNPMTAFDPMSKIGNQIIHTLIVHFNITRKEAYEKAINILKKMNLGREETIMKSYPHMLSGGMLQRIMIAIAIMLESKLIIADEVTTAVDANNRMKIINEFRSLRKDGISMIVITHDFNVLSSLADDIIVLKEGEIIESGVAQQILSRPVKKFTKELLYASNLIGELR